MWARLLSSTNQPSFLSPKELHEAKKTEQPPSQLLEGSNCNDIGEAEKKENTSPQLLQGDSFKDEKQSENHADNGI